MEQQLVSENRMDILKNGKSSFQAILMKCYEQKLLRKCNEEKNLGVLSLQEQNPRTLLVIHPEVEDSYIDWIKDIYKRSDEERLKVPEQKSSICEVLEYVETNTIYYNMTLMERELTVQDYNEMERRMRQWSEGELHRVLQLCCFFEVNEVDAIILSTMMSSLLDMGRNCTSIVQAMQEIENRMKMSQGLDILINANEYQVASSAYEKARLKLGANTISVSMRQCEPDEQQTTREFTTKEMANVSEEDIFISTSFQVALLYYRVIMHKEGLYSFFSSYIASNKNSENLEEKKKVLRIMLMRKVMNRIYTIICLSQQTETLVPVMKYNQWNRLNVRNIVLQKKRDNELLLAEQCKRMFCAK